jgi:RHS repeat-associated protein
VNTTADFWGDYGLSATINDQANLFAQHDGSTANDTLNEETRYRARFHVDPNSVNIGTLETIDLFIGFHGADPIFKVQLRDNSGTYQIQAGVYDDSLNYTYTSWYDISDHWTGVEIDWMASPQAGADDGHLTLWLDRTEKQTLSGVDNDTHWVDSVKLGAMGLGTGTSGALYFDDFEARRYSYIGAMEDSGVPDPEPALPDGWLGATYSYDKENAPAHAVVSVARQQFLGDENPVTDTYTYDNNGNMTCRTESNQTWVQTYNAENRISVVEKVTGDCTTHGTTTDTWTFTYDGDGVRVKEVYSGTGDSYTKYYFAGGAYEIEVVGETTTIKRYYSISGMMVAMHNGTDLVYFASDHLSSASLVMDDSGTLLSENRYMPFGEVRTISGTTNITETDFGYTGQRNLASIGLMDYDARFYSPTLMRFIQPDTIVPDLLSPQSFNRYSYVINNPLFFTDPTGFKMYCADGVCSPNPVQGYAQDYLQMYGSRDGKHLLDGRSSNQGDGGGGAPGSVDEDVSSGGAGGGNGNGSGGGYSPDIPGWVPGWAEDDANNINMAWYILHNPNATTAQQLFAVSYLGAWGFAGVCGAIGLGMLTYAGIEAIVALSADGDPTNEANWIIDEYNQLRELVRGTGLERHHLVEQRFSALFGTNPNTWPSVLVTPEEHQIFTNLMRDAIPYSNSPAAINTLTASPENILNAVTTIYAEYPSLLETTLQWLSQQ